MHIDCIDYLDGNAASVVLIHALQQAGTGQSTPIWSPCWSLLRHWVVNISSCIARSEQISSGTLPVSMLSWRVKISRDVSTPSSVGTVPENLLLFTDKKERFVNSPSSGGSVPVNVLL